MLEAKPDLKPFFLLFFYLISEEFSQSGQTLFFFTVTFQAVESKPFEATVNRRCYLPTLSNNIYLPRVQWQEINVAQRSCEGLITLR